MRKEFVGYYAYSNNKLEKIWDNCIFVFDANIILNIYRYSIETRDKFFEILNSFEERIWMPHQVGKEFFNNRLNVISEQNKAYENIKTSLSFTKLKDVIYKYKKHTTIDINKIQGVLDETEKKIQEMLNEAEHSHENYMEKDEALEVILDIFDGKVGKSYDDVKLKALYKEAQARFEKKIPPGYEDNKKNGENKYNDFILWSQIKDHAKEQQKPIIFVTDDAKEDWWQKYEGKTIGPRPELINEICKEHNVEFYMYPSTKFIEYASEYLKIAVSNNTVDEIRKVRNSNEETFNNYFESNNPSHLLNYVRVATVDLINGILTINGIIIDKKISTYIKNDIVYLSLKHSSLIFDISENNIFWNDDIRTITLWKDNKVVKSVIGSNDVEVNGVMIDGDNAKIISESGRTMIDILYFAQLFNVETTFDRNNRVINFHITKR